jgi:uncharacterized protein YndB with AHSA1/START domain
MVTIQREAVLPAPPERVWDVATPLEGWPDWLSLHVRWPVPPPDEVAEGTEFRQVVSLVGLPIPMRWTVTECEAPRLFAMSGTAIAGVKVTIRFAIDEHPDGSALTVTAVLEGALVSGTLQGTVQKFADAQLTASTSALAGLLRSAR